MQKLIYMYKCVYIHIYKDIHMYIFVYTCLYMYKHKINMYMQICMGFPGGSDGKESICNAGDLGPIPGLGRSLGEGKGYPLQYSGLENSSQTQLSLSLLLNCML